jgi:hypothetical protein
VDGLQRQRSAFGPRDGSMAIGTHLGAVNKPASDARRCFAWMGGRAAGYGEAAADCVSSVGLCRVCCARCNGVGSGVVSVSRDGGWRISLLRLRYSFVLRLPGAGELPSTSQRSRWEGRKSAPRSERRPEEIRNGLEVHPSQGGDWLASEITCPGIEAPTHDMMTRTPGTRR